MSRNRPAGVYAVDADGAVGLVHAWMGEDYELADLPEFLQAGRWESDDVLVVSAAEVQRLKVRAAAESFDHEEGLIQLCLDLARFMEEEGLGQARLVEIG